MNCNICQNPLSSTQELISIQFIKPPQNFVDCGTVLRKLRVCESCSNVCMIAIDDGLNLYQGGEISGKRPKP
jgi:hypothetical protein